MQSQTLRLQSHAMSPLHKLQLASHVYMPIFGRLMVAFLEYDKKWTIACRGPIHCMRRRVKGYNAYAHLPVHYRCSACKRQQDASQFSL